MSITRKKDLLGLAVLCVTIPVILVAQAAEKKTFMGVWEVKISAGGVPPSPLLSVAIFGGDGSFTTTGNIKFSLVPPNQGLADARGPGYGRWAQTADREFRLTFYVPLLKGGEVNGYMRVRCTMRLSESGDEFKSHECLAEFLDANWKVLDSDKDEVTFVYIEAGPYHDGVRFSTGAEVTLQKLGVGVRARVIDALAMAPLPDVEGDEKTARSDELVLA